MKSYIIIIQGATAPFVKKLPKIIKIDKKVIPLRCHHDGVRMEST